MDWSNKVVLVTGASSGIGRGLAVELARRGASVGLLARRRDLLEEVVDEINEAGGRAMALPADVTHADQVRAAACELRRKFGYIDLLVANAGVGGTTYAVDLCEKEVTQSHSRECDWRREQRDGGHPAHDSTGERTPGGDLQSRRLSRLAKVGCLLREQGRRFRFV